MRLARIALCVGVSLAAIAAWPQKGSPPPVDHSQHVVVNTPTDRPIPSLIVRLVPDTMDGYNLFLETQNFRFTPQNVDREIIVGEGHAHLYLNGEKVARLYSPWRHLPRQMFREGITRLQVEFNANDHSIWGVAGEPIGADVLIDPSVTNDDPIVREEVRYTLDWDWGQAKRHRDGGWTVVTDLGYSVHVTSGRLVTRNLELTPCHTMPMTSPVARLFDWLRPPTAYAGHGSLLPNASKISRSYEEDLAGPKRKYLEARIVTDPEYCQAHYLIARAKGMGPGEFALEVEGTWRKKAADPPTAFRITSPAAYGQMKELLSPSGERSRRTIVGGVDVTVRRSLDKVFDGIDFASGGLAAAGMRVMRSLVANAQIEVNDL